MSFFTKIHPNPLSARPLLLLFALPEREAEIKDKRKARPEPVAVVKEDENKPDGYTPEGRLRQGVASVQRFLVQSQVVDVKLYVPEDPTVIRAGFEGRVRVLPAGEMDERSRLKLAQAMGALYLMTVAIERVPEKSIEKYDGNSLGDPMGDSMRLLAVLTDVKTRKSWREEAKAGAGATSDSLIPVSVGNGRNNVYDTLSNTIVMRFMAGPLRSYAKFIPDPAMLPQSPRPLDLTVKPMDREEEARSIRTRAETLLKDNRIEDGIGILRRAVNLTPRASEGRIALIQAYLDNQYLGEAIIESRRALQVVPVTDTAGRQKIVALLLEAAQRKGDSATLRVALERLLQDDPNNLDLRIQYAGAILLQGDKIEAERIFQEVLKMKPDNLGASNGLLQLSLLEGDVNKAIQISENPNLSPMGRCLATQVLVKNILEKTHTDFTHNKSGWTQSTLSREFFYKAINAQNERVKIASKQLEKHVTPSILREAAESVSQTYHVQKRQISALGQILSKMSNHLESGDVAARAEVDELLEAWGK
jgi:tetratricopeptide (TPR) repeat protein